MFGRWGVFVLAVLAAGAVLSSSAGASTQGVRTVDVSTRAAVVTYLRSLGVNPHGMVVQRGLHNYVGPSCPGRGWTCTTSKRVLQIATTASSTNTFVCSASNAFGGSATPPGDCTVVQVAATATASNTASCTESSSASDASQSCVIFQTSTGGANKATVGQSVSTLAGSSQTPTQYTGINQSSADGSNTITVVQSVTALVNQVDASGSQSQNAHQGASLTQFATGAGNNTSTLSQTQSLKAAAQQRPSLTQNQNTDESQGPNTNADFEQTSGSGKNTATSGQSITYVGNIQQAATGFQQQGAPSNGLAAVFNQSSTGLSTITGKQTESQTQRADRIGSLTQFQYGPAWFDPNQFSNTGNKYTLNQSSTQNANDPTFQDDQEYAQCFTSGNCIANEFISQNGKTTTNSCTGQSCDFGTTSSNEGGEQSSFTCGGDDSDGCDVSFPDAPPLPPNPNPLQ